MKGIKIAIVKKTWYTNARVLIVFLLLDFDCLNVRLFFYFLNLRYSHDLYLPSLIN